ncbi:MAG: aspartate-semialdehyde dehydrogenase [Actinomycetota bacterium]
MGFRVGIAGATGATGQMTLLLLHERRFPVDELRLFASRRSVGRRIPWGSGEVAVEALEDGRFDGLDLVLNATSASLAREWVPRMVAAGAFVSDKSSAFRLDPDVPLVVPEINQAEAQLHKGIVASPNCTTAVALMAMAPLHQAVGIEAVISSSYQSVSGVGRDAVSELIEGTRKAVEHVDALWGREPIDLPEPTAFPHQLAFNVFPQCETFSDDSDESTEESKMQGEARRILDAPKLVLQATAVRVPVVVGHSVSLSLALDREVSPAEAREIIDAFPGVRVLDAPSRGAYPTPRQATGIDDVLVGRIRSNPILENGLTLFASGDNLRKGASLNAIQTAELVLGV